MQVAFSALLAASIPAALAVEQGNMKSSGGRVGAPEARAQAERQTQAEARNQKQFSGKITSVNKRDKTITVEDRQFGKETLHIGPDTRIMKGSEAAGWDQIREGEQVKATASKSGDTNHALFLEIGK